MNQHISTVEDFIEGSKTQDLATSDLETALGELATCSAFQTFLQEITVADVYGKEVGIAFKERGVMSAISPYRTLRSALGMRLGQFLRQLAILVRAFDRLIGEDWQRFASRVEESSFTKVKLVDLLQDGRLGKSYSTWIETLTQKSPHAVYPTSPYRESGGSVVSGDEFQHVEAVMSSRTSTSIRVVENVLNRSQSLLRDIYKPLGRCVCLIDQNVEQFIGDQVDSYFAFHGIELEKLVYRAMEVDKGIQTVERMLGDFKRLGVSRNEPVLIVGGGVLSDTGGLACSLYHRGTPYVMLSTSLVAGVDAGPSPRTCCDGFGYKNLFGAYHTPMISITDRTLFRTLKPGWLRHGIAEIIKMAVVKDKDLFNDLELAGDVLVETRFGSLIEKKRSSIHNISRRILGRAIKSYVEAEYGNLYETHQCRPHAYGHTWSPGFEIPAGLLHGHAVSIGMGFGAFMSLRQDWISERECHRILRLISSFDLSLWHEVLSDRQAIWDAQVKMVEKRGGHLAAPLPQHEIGKCGYLNDLSQSELFDALDDYEKICRSFDRSGHGTEAHCRDVGLEDPSTVGQAFDLTL
ncbi:MAG: sedoheptulose 7-phosphate cyclase [Pseudomonadota bacterium]